MPIKKNNFCVDQYDEIGHRLYYRCINNKKRKEEKLNKIRLEKERLSPDITFHPKISKKTREITKNVNNKIKIEDRLIARQRKRKKIIKKKLLKNVS